MKSADMCIFTNDFIAAKQRYDASNARWLKYWFDTCYTIAKKNPVYLSKYLFDEVNFIITKVQVVVKYTDPAPSHTYLINLLDRNEEAVFTKIGKANDVAVRLNKILKDGYKGVDIDDVNIVKVYEMPADDLAEALESLIKHYIKKNKSVGYYPQDRFTPFDFTEEDFFKFENIRNTILALFE